MPFCNFLCILHLDIWLHIQPRAVHLLWIYKSWLTSLWISWLNRICKTRRKYGLRILKSTNTTLEPPLLQWSETDWNTFSWFRYSWPCGIVELGIGMKFIFPLVETHSAFTKIVYFPELSECIPFHNGLEFGSTEVFFHLYFTFFFK